MKKQILTMTLILLAVFVKSQTTCTVNPATSHTMTLTDAAELTKNYRDNAPSGAIISHAFGKNDLISLLNQTNATGLRIYYGQDVNGNPHLVIVAVECSGDDITNGYILQRSIYCPTFCPHANTLNTD